MPGQLDLCNGLLPLGRCGHACEPRPQAEGVASAASRGDPLSVLGLLDCHSTGHPAHDRVRCNPSPFSSEAVPMLQGTGVRDVGSVPPIAKLSWCGPCSDGCTCVTRHEPSKSKARHSAWGFSGSWRLW